MNEDLPRRVSARTGLTWVTDAFRLFFKSPLILSTGSALFIGVAILLQLVPMVGSGLAEIITPMLVAGFMRAYRSVEEGEDPELPQLLAGFRSHQLPLAMVGAIYLALLLGIDTLMRTLGLDYQVIMDAVQKGSDLQPIAAQLEGKNLLILLGAALMFCALATTWYAPALVLFGNASPGQAMLLSFKASYRNWAALSLCGLACIPVMFIALVPLIGVLVMFAVLMGTSYLGYQSMFAYQDSGAKS